MSAVLCCDISKEPMYRGTIEWLSTYHDHFENAKPVYDVDPNKLWHELVKLWILIALAYLEK